MAETPTVTPGLKERYSVLLDIGRTLTGTLRPDDLYRAIYEQTSRVLETTGFYISLYDAGSDTATVVFFADRGSVSRDRQSYRGTQSAAIREARPVLARLDSPGQAILLLGEDQQEVTRSSVSAPMLRDGRVLGVVSAQSYRAGVYDEEDLELLAAVADLAAVALWNAQHVEELDRRRREAERLEEIGRALIASLELPEVLRRVVAAAIDLAEADSAHVFLFQPDGVAIAAMTGGNTAFPIGTRVPLPDQIRDRLVERRESVIIDDAKNDPLFPEEIRKRITHASAVIVPLVGENHVIGVLSIGRMDHRGHSLEEVRLLERLSNQASVAVENARLHEEIRALSLTDPLTGLANRRHLEMFLEKEFAAAQRGRALAVVLFDLDRFKEYNDAVGHQAGDEILRAFARVLTSQTRAMNLGARYGGDEFLAILADTPLDGALIHAGRVADAVVSDPALHGIGVSAGVASYTRGMSCPEDLIRAADLDLYRRKADRAAHPTS